ncbi:MAG: UDP-3-O-acyl-N-acetylglucosamine deacetylase [Elusimicrobiota bacterium]
MPNNKPQCTIAEEINLSGIGIHTGKEANVTLKPADVNCGVKFVRVDLKDSPPIPAQIEYVTGVMRGTTLENGKAKVQTVEHLLASLYGLGIDNLTVEIDKSEMPVGDGSAKIFVESIQKAGIKKQEASKKYFQPEEPVSISAGSADIIAFPSDNLTISSVIYYGDNVLGSQYKKLDITEENFINEIASARTYCFEEEIELIKEKGLGKGGNENNTIVIGNEEIKNTKLRFKDEFVRHKLLDFLGDLYLLGCNLKARVIAIRCGHNSNIQFTRKLKEKMDKSSRSTGKVLNVDQLKEILPHRYPFLLVDKIEVGDSMKTAIGYKNITIDEPVFKGHYPEEAVFPPALIIEFMAQSSAVMLLTKPEVKNKLAYFIIIDKVKFYGDVKPMDVLKSEVELIRARSKGGKVRGETFVGDRKVAQAEFMFTLVEK